MKNISSTIILSLLVLLISLGVFSSVRWESLNQDEDTVTVFNTSNKSSDFFQQEGGTITESEQYIPDIKTKAEDLLEPGELVGPVAVLDPYAIQYIQGSTSTDRIIILQRSLETSTWETLRITDRQIDAEYLNSIGIPTNDARQLMRLYRRALP